MNNPTLSVDASRLAFRILFVCIAIEVFLVLLDATVNMGRWTTLGPIRRLSNIAREDGLASWLGTTQMLLVALTIWLIFILARASAVSRGRSVCWAIVAAFFTYMAADDGAKIHERLGSAFKQSVEESSAIEDSTAWGSVLLDAFPSYPWQLVVGPFFVVMGIFVFVFLWREMTNRTSRVLIIAALSCFVFAIGLDFIEGLDEDHRFNLHTWIREVYGLKTVRHYSKSLEESIEMLGTSLFWAAFIRHLPRTTEGFSIQFK